MESTKSSSVNSLGLGLAVSFAAGPVGVSLSILRAFAGWWGEGPADIEGASIPDSTCLEMLPGSKLLLLPKTEADARNSAERHAPPSAAGVLDQPLDCERDVQELRNPQSQCLRRSPFVPVDQMQPRAIGKDEVELVDHALPH